MDSSNFYTLATLLLSVNSTCGATRHSIQLHVAWAAFVKHSPAKHREHYWRYGFKSVADLSRDFSINPDLQNISGNFKLTFAESSFGFNLLHAGFPDVGCHLLYDSNTLCDPEMEAMPQALWRYAMHQTSPTQTSSSLEPNTSFEPYLANYYEHKQTLA